MLRVYLAGVARLLNISLFCVNELRLECLFIKEKIKICLRRFQCQRVLYKMSEIRILAERGLFIYLWVYLIEMPTPRKGFIFSLENYASGLEVHQGAF